MLVCISEMKIAERKHRNSKYEQNQIRFSCSSKTKQPVLASKSGCTLVTVHHCLHDKAPRYLVYCCTTGVRFSKHKL